MAIRIVQLGTARAQDEGLRLGTVRRPPRGVPKAEFASRDYLRRLAAEPVAQRRTRRARPGRGQTTRNGPPSAASSARR